MNVRYSAQAGQAGVPMTVNMRVSYFGANLASYILQISILLYSQLVYVNFHENGATHLSSPPKNQEPPKTATNCKLRIVVVFYCRKYSWQIHFYIVE